MSRYNHCDRIVVAIDLLRKYLDFHFTFSVQQAIKKVLFLGDPKSEFTLESLEW